MLKFLTFYGQLFLYEIIQPTEPNIYRLTQLSTTQHRSFKHVNKHRRLIQGTAINKKMECILSVFDSFFIDKTFLHKCCCRTSASAFETLKLLNIELTRNREKLGNSWLLWSIFAYVIIYVNFTDDDDFELMIYTDDFKR